MADQEFDLGRCLQQVRERNEDAARALVEALYPLVIRIVRRHLPVRSTEEDLAQEIFARLFSRLERYEQRAGVPLSIGWRGWRCGPVSMPCARERRRPEIRWTDLPPEQSEWLSYLVSEPAQPPATEAHSARELLELLLAQLPAEDRLIINLLDLDERSVKDIGELTGWSVARVKVRAFRARRKLRKLAEKLKRANLYEEF